MGKAAIAQMLLYHQASLLHFCFDDVRSSAISDDEAVAQGSGLGCTAGEIVFAQLAIVLFLSSQGGKVNRMREYSEPAAPVYTSDPGEHGGAAEPRQRRRLAGALQIRPRCWPHPPRAWASAAPAAPAPAATAAAASDESSTAQILTQDAKAFVLYSIA